MSEPQVADFASSALAEAQFYEAFARLDADLMARVWHDSEQAYCVHPGGRPLFGRQAVLGSWRDMFHDAEPLVLFYKVLYRQEWEGMAMHLVEERLSTRDGSLQGLVLASNCYVRISEEWRLFSHHGSSLALRVPTVSEEPPQFH